MDQIWKTTWRGGVPRFEAGVFRDAWICQRTPACYRLNPPSCLPMVLAHTSAMYFLSALTHNQLIRLPCSFKISASFWPFPLVLVRVLSNFSHCVSLLLKWEKNSHQTEYVLCFFLQCEQYKIIKSTEEVFFLLFLFFFFFTADVKKIYIILDLGQCINFTFSSQWISGGRLCSFQNPVSCQHSATGVVSGESGEGLWHKAGGP